MSNFTIKGTGDNATAQLKAALDARDAAFDAQLNAMFQPGPAPEYQPKTDAKPAANAPAPATNGWGNSTSRKKPDGGSMRSRLRS